MKLRRNHWMALLATVIIGAGLVIIRHLQRQRLPVPNENAAGVELLVEAQAGARYFHETSRVPDKEGEPTISPEEVREQIPRVIRERGWGSTEEAKLQKWIDHLTEEPASRIVGSYRINLARLNLALDQLHASPERRP
ncbi:MAG: potassium-transporting ATPase subunit C [Verrucomicrobiota bacterium]